MDPLKILLVEDSEQDAELILREFRARKPPISSQRVWSAVTLRQALGAANWDAILCDFNLPGFDALQALQVVNEAALDIPFIIVSGVIGEETAVAAMRAGAHDYLLKSSLPRLVPAVEREIKEARLRKAKRQADESLRNALVALHRSQSRYQRLVDASSLGILVADLDGSLLEANDAYLGLLGFTRVDFERGLSWIELTPESYRELDSRHIDEMKQRGACTPYEKEYRRKDGTLVPVLIGYALLEDEPNRCICFVADMTERRKIEMQLEKAVHARDEFISVASHELKSPVTSVSLQLQLLRRKLAKLPSGDPMAVDLEKPVSSMLRQLKRLSGLVDDLLDVTRVAHGRLSIRTEHVNAVELVQDVLSRFADQATEAHCKFSVELPAELPVEWDPQRIDQVLANLIGNAIKYAPGQPIGVRVSSVDGVIRIVVADGGPGISPQDQARIFDRFERVEATSGAAGLGLGLYIVKQIVESHGGAIRVQSERGQGCQFIVELPLRVAADAVVC